MPTNLISDADKKDLANRAAGSDGDKGDARTKAVTAQLLYRLMQVIDECDVSMDEFWAAVAFIGKAAAQGVGKQVALDAAAEGARLMIIDRSAIIQEVAQEIASTYGAERVVALVEDLETFAGSERVMARAKESFGAIDVLVTNIGGAIWMRPFQEFDERQIVAEINRSPFPTLCGCRALLPNMQAQGRGAIVNVSSIATKGINRIPIRRARTA